VACLSQKIGIADRELDTVYRAVLAKMAENDPSDRRKNKDQLMKAQTAWKTFVQANCAYIAGNEVGSNLCVTNSASRCDLRATRERIAFFRSKAAKSPAPATQAEPASNSVQQFLDLRAAPPPADSTLPKLPSLYAAWTEQQRRTAPRQIAARCAVLWTMMNSGGPLHLLPSAQDPADTPKLASELCALGKMRQDRPARIAMKSDIDRILRRSSELGQPLSIPARLVP
jgi:uncharacterized protein YecT (DUF1311 family)